MSTQRISIAVLTASLLSVGAFASGAAHAGSIGLLAASEGVHFEQRYGMRDEYLPPGSVRTPWTVHESGFIQE